MTEELEQLLKNLQLKKIAQILERETRHAEKEAIPYQEFLLRLVRPQWYAKQEKSTEWRIRNAKLPERWALETFPFHLQTGVDRRQINTLADLTFIPRTENLVFIGPTGVGKTGLASALLLRALQNGFRGRFIKAQDLFDDMYASLADRSSRNLIKQLANFDLLLIDEMGYLNLRPEQSNLFFKLMDERYKRRATLITTNLEYDEWQEFLGNRPMVEALLSRLRHRCHTVRIDGPSLRTPQG